MDALDGLMSDSAAVEVRHRAKMAASSPGLDLQTIGYQDYGFDESSRW
jgi:hypothetical protein